MIADASVFSDAYPADMLYRHQEKTKVSRALEPAYNGKRADDVVIWGPSGVGKTIAARHLVADLRAEESVPATRIKGLDKSPNAILTQTIEDHPSEVIVHENTKRKTLRDRLESVAETPYIVIVDEADGVRDLAVLDDLTSAPLVSVIAVTHDLEGWSDSISGVDHHFPTDVRFGPYPADQLVEILKLRARRGFSAKIVTETQLEMIAKRTDGVARYAIKALLAAAEIGEENGHNRIYDEDIADCYDRARRKMRESNLRSLPFGHRAVYELLRQAGGSLETSEVKRLWNDHAEAIYADRGHDDVSWRHARNYLNKLDEYDLVDTADGRWGTYDIEDVEIAGRVAIPPEVTEFAS